MYYLFLFDSYQQWVAASALQFARQTIAYEDLPALRGGRSIPPVKSPESFIHSVDAHASGATSARPVANVSFQRD